MTAFALVSSGIACTPPRCDGPSSPMIGGMRSHQSLADVRHALDGTLTIDPCSHVPCRAGELRVRVDGFDHLGHSGRLRLTFSDGRLYQAVFEPSSPEAYFTKVASMTGALRPADGELWLDPSTRVHVVRGQGERGVAWEDDCIAEEVASRQ